MTDTVRGYEPEIDPVWHLMPADQIDRVFSQDMCEIAPEFLGFTNVYLALASIIPKHWTIVDLGCAYAPQAIIFRDHKAYIGVDISECQRFSAPNTTHYTMTIASFLDKHARDFRQESTFAICSYVPDWYRSDNKALARHHFRNVFTYYPSRDPDEPCFFRALPPEGAEP